MKNQVDTGLLIPGSEIGIYSAVNFQIGAVHGIEFAYDIGPPKGRNYGYNASFNYTYSIAAPEGLDNTGAPAPAFNDHDQRNTLGLDAGYTWKSGVFASLTIDYGSGLTSSAIPPSTLRIPRTEIDLRAGTGNRLFHGHGGIGLSIENLLDARTVINFESGFSGTRFMEGAPYPPQHEPDVLRLGGGGGGVRNEVEKGRIDSLGLLLGHIGVDKVVVESLCSGELEGVDLIRGALAPTRHDACRHLIVDGGIVGVGNDEDRLSGGTLFRRFLLRGETEAQQLREGMRRPARIVEVRLRAGRDACRPTS